MLSVQDIALRLSEARVGCLPADSTGCHIPDLPYAYSVARETRANAVAKGERVIGYKVGLTSGPSQEAFAALEPAAGYVLESTTVASGSTIRAPHVADLAVEVEIAFCLNRELTNPELSVQDVLDATAYVAPALEIVGSRWHEGTGNLPMLVADNANAVAAVLGDWIEVPTDLANVASVLKLSEHEVVGHSNSVLGNPAKSVVWLARHLIGEGTPLRAGDIVLSGTLSPPTAAIGAPNASAQLAGIGSVSINFKWGCI